METSISKELHIKKPTEKNKESIEGVEDPMDLSEGKHAIMKTFGRTLINATRLKMDGVAYPKCPCPVYAIKDLTGKIVSSFILGQSDSSSSLYYNEPLNQRDKNLLAFEIDNNIAEIIIKKKGLTIINTTPKNKLGASTNEIYKNDILITTINNVIYPFSSFERSFLKKLNEDGILRTKLQKTSEKENTDEDKFNKIEKKLLKISAQELLETGNGSLFYEIHDNRDTIPEKIVVLFKAKLIEFYGNKGYDGKDLVNIVIQGNKMFGSKNINGERITISFGP